MINVIHGGHRLLRVVSVLALALLRPDRIGRGPFVCVVATRCDSLIVVETALRHVPAAPLRSDLQRHVIQTQLRTCIALLGCSGRRYDIAEVLRILSCLLLGLDGLTQQTLIGTIDG